jgi:hypothetical protein
LYLLYVALIWFGSLRLGLRNGTAQQVLTAAVFAPLLQGHADNVEGE